MRGGAVAEGTGRRGGGGGGWGWRGRADGGVILVDRKKTALSDTRLMKIRGHQIARKTDKNKLINE